MSESVIVTPEMFEEHWPLSGVRIGRVLRKFVGRTVGVIETEQGHFVYKVTPSDATQAEAERRSYISDFLQERSFAHVPSLLQASDDSRQLIAGDTTVRVMEYIDGVQPSPTPGNYLHLGRILSQLNAITDFPYDCRINVDAIRPEFPGVSKFLKSERDRERFVEVANGLDDLSGQPRSLIHFEMTLGNTVQKPDGTIIVVDWDEAGMGARVLDPGALLIASFVSEDLSIDRMGATAFFQGYNSVNRLDDGEVEALFDASVFHALRYIRWANPERRWARIEWAIEHRSELLSLARG